MLALDLHQKDTICAAATPAFPSAISVIRVSGRDALSIKEQVFSPKKGLQKFFVATLGDVTGIDEAVCVAYPHGKSYTGEAAFELSVHGSPIIVYEVLKKLQDAGCRMAEPGEFSLRAVLNHKMDLCAAESVCDLISARSKEAAQVALRNVKGGLGKFLQPTRSCIVDVLCEMEARLDFPDEDLGEKQKERLLLDMENAAKLLQKLLDGAELGQKLIEGARVLLFGLPNAGKSTLLNTLLGQERALVHHLPGTTRDVVEALLVLGGIPVSLVDVAGIRDVQIAETVEALGIEKAHNEMERADAILWLIDATDTDAAKQTYLESLIQTIQAPVLKVFTKTDLLATKDFLKSPFEDGVLISAKTGAGIKELHAQVLQLLRKDASGQQEILLTRERQKVQVQIAHESLLLARKALQIGEADEVVASELRVAGEALDKLLGKSINQDVLDLIFSRFCIGK